MDNVLSLGADECARSVAQGGDDFVLANGLVRDEDVTLSGLRYRSRRKDKITNVFE